MANGVSGRPKAADLTSRCTANNAQGTRCGNAPAAGSGMCLAHLGRLDADERAELRRTRKDAVKLLAHARTQAVSALVQILMSGSVAERLAASRVILSVTSTPEESRMTNAVLIADGLEDGGTVDAVSPGELVRERLAALRARQAPEDISPAPDHVDASRTATAPGNGNLAPVVLLPTPGPLVQRQLLPGRPVGGGEPVVVDADPAEPQGASAALNARLSADRGPGAATPVRRSRTKPGAANAVSGRNAARSAADGAEPDPNPTAGDLGPVHPEPISVDIVDTVDAVDTPCSSAFTDDGRGEQRTEHALPGWVAGRRRRSVADDSEVIVPAAPGVPPVRRRRTSPEEIANRRMPGRGL